MINDFRGQYRWLSNFEICEVQYEGTIFPSSEHAYQAAKATNMADFNKFLYCKTPGDAKRMGGKIKLRPDWDKIKYDIMYEIVKSKFTRNVRLREKLLNTGNVQLVEGNTWGDTYWGVCDGVGENNLGKILMLVREELANEQERYLSVY